MSEFFFKCPHCGANLSAEDSMIGTQMPCPSCDTPIIVRRPQSRKIHSSNNVRHRSGTITIEQTSKDLKLRNCLGCLVFMISLLIIMFGFIITENTIVRFCLCIPAIASVIYLIIIDFMVWWEHG